jgi:hypothetical protein
MVAHELPYVRLPISFELKTQNIIMPDEDFPIPQ